MHPEISQEPQYPQLPGDMDVSCYTHWRKGLHFSSASMPGHTGFYCEKPELCTVIDAMFPMAVKIMLGQKTFFSLLQPAYCGSESEDLLHCVYRE